MPFSLTQFTEDSGFERYALGDLAPAITASPGLQVIDYLDETRDQPRIHAIVGTSPVKAVVTIGGQPATVNVTPLIFGMAWKILDLVIEPLLSPRTDGRPQTIEAKVRTALNGLGPQGVKPFHREPELWKRFMHLYGNTVDLRHSVVHGQLNVDADGTLTATSRDPAPLVPPTTMTTDELGYFLRAVQGFSAALLGEHLSVRARNNLCFLLDQLTQHHGLDKLGGVELLRRVVVVARPKPLPSGKFLFDARPYLAYSLDRFPGAGCDVNLHFPDNIVLGGELEDAPTDGPLEIRLDYPPKWLDYL
ncbi:hypothetical protein DQ384_21835 [Sphaerisporangium album]|uniref:Uncharacterized protein n=1 Tax=Sphaerisporangium album TaxID=509200 RepID=A0A367FH16_9ACTN|nr:hypothetical protein [Sphaerisporangium album]RCG28997.1 hypothetical protein DQ384_21835 [Sphaerisporangium album]